MNEPAAIWSLQRVIFDKAIGNTQNIILTQGASALKATINRIDKLQELINNSPIKNTFIDPDIPPTLSDLCAQAGVAATILFNDNRQGRLETDIAYTLRKERIKYVKDLCDAQNFISLTLTNREVRNSLTHIDERLADILTSDPNIGWFIDIAIPNRNEFSAPNGITIKFCRSYIANENKILHLDQELDLKNLRQECVVILAIVFGI